MAAKRKADEGRLDEASPVTCEWAWQGLERRALEQAAAWTAVADDVANADHPLSQSLKSLTEKHNHSADILEELQAERKRREALSVLHAAIGSVARASEKRQEGRLASAGCASG